jgi:hypothetical protein
MLQALDFRYPGGAADPPLEIGFGALVVADGGVTDELALGPAGRSSDGLRN